MLLEPLTQKGPRVEITVPQVGQTDGLSSLHANLMPNPNYPFNTGHIQTSTQQSSHYTLELQGRPQGSFYHVLLE